MIRPDLVVIRPDLVATRLTLLDAITPASAAPDATHDPAEFTPGARVQARVEAQLAGGGFRVLVANTSMQMQLPPGIRPGATLDLMFVGGQPRPTFVLLNPPPAAQNNAVLSPTAHLLGKLAQEAKTTPVTAPPYQAAPVLEKPPGDVREFSMRLQQAFSQSGLFYESHQAQWLAGRRTLEQLLQEPQGRLSETAPRNTANPSPAERPGKQELTGRRAPDQSPQDLQGKLAENPSNNRPSTATPAPAHGKPGGPDSMPLQAIVRSELSSTEAQATPERPLLHKETLPLVQQQLATLDTGQMLWRGEVWPGQTLDWQVGSEPSEQDNGEEPQRWHSRLRLTLPQLGQITALLVFDARGIRIALSATSAPAVEALRGGQASLVQAMQDSGMNISGIEVQHNDEA